jgi:hypothetical protein
MTRPEEQTEVMSTTTVAELPESIREHRVLVNLAEWIMMRYPPRRFLNTRVKQRIGVDAA